MEGTADQSSLIVVVTSVGGHELSLDMTTADTVNDVRLLLASKLEVVADALVFFASSGVVPYSAKLNELDRTDDGSLPIQFIEVDPMLDLGKFNASPHSGVRVDFHPGPQGNHSTLVKTSNQPDSSNVFLLGRIVRPCFVEFEVTNTFDEMSFGVTYEADVVTKASDFANLHLSNTWVISKRSCMPVLLFGGKKPAPADQFKHGFATGDRVILIADPEARQVRFYRNGELVADNLPDHPLPVFDPDAAPLRVYCMVDAKNDEIRVARWGPAEVLLAYAAA